jgi:hypothetical protein
VRGDELERRADHTARDVFPTMRSFTERAQGFDKQQLLDVLRAQLSRPGRPGSRLSPPQRARWHEQLAALVRDVEGPTSQRVLFDLCRDAARAAWSHLPTASRSRRDPRATVDNARRLARASLVAEWGGEGTDDERVRRALTRAVRERRRADRETARLELPDGDPLRAMLSLPASGVVRLPKNDVRAHLVRARSREGERGTLPDLLRRASRFSERTLRPVLGEELWGLCRPVGFADRHGRVITVQVDNAALAHEISMRKRELLSRLRAAPGFENARDVRFKVGEPKKPA